MILFVVNDISETEIGDEYSSMKEKTDDIIESKDFHNEMMEDLRKKRDLKVLLIIVYNGSTWSSLF